MFVYGISRPAENGETSSFNKWMSKTILANNEDWEAIQQRQTALIDQAAKDKHILLYAPGNNGHHELKYPE